MCHHFFEFPTLDLLFRSDGDLTQVGEKGISLSGGQKQRINIARALYFDAPITLFDDSFSALDAHVGYAVFKNVILGALSGRTRVLVTHALHFLPFVDHIVVLDNGEIAERGSYDNLVEKGNVFGELVKQFGVQGGEEMKEEEKEEDVGEEKEGEGKANKAFKPAAAIMQAEERYTGSVGWQSKRPFTLLEASPHPP
jgi:ATP-binding cassette subfamily C (CFTR/MRP) protein 1